MKKLTIEYVKQRTTEIAEGYSCLSDEYKNSQIKLKFTCPKDHIFKMRWNSFQQGYKCSTCYGNKKLNIEYIKSKTKELESGYKCLSDKYVSNSTKLIFKCNRIHEFYMTWNDFQQRQRCPICYRENNKGKNHPSWKGGVTKKNIALFDTYAHQIDFCEEVGRDPDNYDWLQVRCAEINCGKWFNPTMKEVCIRLSALNRIKQGDGRFYCSQKCKDNCSIFNQIKYPRGFINTNNIRYDQAEWAGMVKERDEYQCVKCEAIDNLVAHHIEGLIENPIESADIDIGITLCADCHKEVHSEIGCRRIDLTKESICNAL